MSDKKRHKQRNSDSSGQLLAAAAALGLSLGVNMDDAFGQNMKNAKPSSLDGKGNDALKQGLRLKKASPSADTAKAASESPGVQKQQRRSTQMKYEGRQEPGSRQIKLPGTIAPKTDSADGSDVSPSKTGAGSPGSRQMKFDGMDGDAKGDQKARSGTDVGNPASPRKRLEGQQGPGSRQTKFETGKPGANQMKIDRVETPGATQGKIIWQENRPQSFGPGARQEKVEAPKRQRGFPGRGEN